MAIAAEVAVPEIVAKDDDDIGSTSLRRSCAESREEAAKQRSDTRQGAKWKG
jgi:hypothetical protein